MRQYRRLSAQIRRGTRLRVAAVYPIVRRCAPAHALSPEVATKRRGERERRAVPKPFPNVPMRSQTFPNDCQMIPKQFPNDSQNVPNPLFNRSRLKHMPFSRGMSRSPLDVFRAIVRARQNAPTPCSRARRSVTFPPPIASPTERRMTRRRKPDPGLIQP
jgi:hypothetical protein